MTSGTGREVVLVTGAASGIGKATALAFAARCATVICTDINEEAVVGVASSCSQRGAAAGPLLRRRRFRWDGDDQVTDRMAMVTFKGI